MIEGQQRESSHGYREIRKLVVGRMPVYDEWGAMLYVLWYQPSHINMAYTTALQLLGRDDPDRSGDWPLHVTILVVAP